MKNLKLSLTTDDIDYSWIEHADLVRKRFDPVESFVKRSRDSFNRRLEDYLIDNLKRIGYTFHSKQHFYDFCKERVQRLSFEDIPNEYRFYLDYENESNTGTYIGAYCDNISIKHEGNTVTATFGRQLNQQKNL